MNEKIRIYVTAHKPFRLPKGIDTSLFVPIFCGKAVYDPEEFPAPSGRFILPELGDDTGDNRSIENRHYSELTGHYWIWKNDKDSDIIGVNHYRRYFYDNENYDLIDRETILKNLKEYDFMVSGPSSDSKPWYDEEWSIYNGYKASHNICDMDNALLACKRLYPELYDKFEYEIKMGTCMCLCNLMICKKEKFNEYCSFLFSIIDEVRKTIDYDDPKYQQYQIRVFGFLGERMFRPWLIAKGYKFKDQQIFTFE